MCTPGNLSMRSVNTQTCVNAALFFAILYGTNWKIKQLQVRLLF